MESREVLAQLAKQGINIHRETLARMSDELGLETRTGTGRTVPRHWSPGQFRILLAHLQTTDSDARGPRPLQGLTEANGPFPSREVLAHLRHYGFDIHRGRLASISDKLGLQTRVGADSRIPREWTHDQVEAVLTFLQDQPLQRLRERQERQEQKERERQEERLRLRQEQEQQEKLRRQQQEQRRRQQEEQEQERLRLRLRQERSRKLAALAKDLLVDAALDLETPQLQALLAGEPEPTDRFLGQVTALLQELVSTDNLTEQPNDEGRDTSTEAA